METKKTPEEIMQLKRSAVKKRFLENGNPITSDICYNYKLPFLYYTDYHKTVKKVAIHSYNKIGGFRIFEIGIAPSSTRIIVFGKNSHHATEINGGQNEYFTDVKRLVRTLKEKNELEIKRKRELIEITEREIENLQSNPFQLVSISEELYTQDVEEIAKNYDNVHSYLEQEKKKEKLYKNLNIT